MALINDPEIIEKLFNDFFDTVFANDDLNKGFRKLNKKIEIVYRKPDVKFLLDCSSDEVCFIPNADGTLKPDVSIIMDWETAHKFWMGSLDTLSALFDQRIKIKGDAAALLDLKPLFKETSKIYKQIVSKHLES